MVTTLRFDQCALIVFRRTKKDDQSILIETSSCNHQFFSELMTYYSSNLPYTNDLLLTSATYNYYSKRMCTWCHRKQSSLTVLPMIRLPFKLPFFLNMTVTTRNRYIVLKSYNSFYAGNWRERDASVYRLHVFKIDVRDFRTWKKKQIGDLGTTISARNTHSWDQKVKCTAGRNKCVND